MVGGVVSFNQTYPRCLEGFEPLRVGWTKGTHAFFGQQKGHENPASVGLVSWLVASYRSKTKMELVIPSKWWFGKCISCQIWLFLFSTLKFGVYLSYKYVHLWSAKKARISWGAPVKSDVYPSRKPMYASWRAKRTYHILAMYTSKNWALQKRLESELTCKSSSSHTPWCLDISSQQLFGRMDTLDV